MIPAIKFNMFSLQIDKDKIDISISGSITADVVNLFIQLFKGVVVDIIENIINEQAPAMITSMVNTAFYNTHGVLVFEKLGGFGFDFAYTAAPVVSDTQVDLYFNATFFNNSFGVVAPADMIVDMGIDTATTNMVQLDVS